MRSRKRTAAGPVMTAEKIARVKKLRLIDDLLFEVFAENRPAIQEMIRTFMSDDSIVVDDVVTQSSKRNIYGRSVKLDALCTFGDGQKCNVEIQRSDNDDHLRRARFNASMITVRDSEPGEHFRDIKDVVVIYVSETDVLGLGKTVYHIEKRIRETGTLVDDGFSEIFVNAEINDGSEIASLMGHFLEEDVDDPKFPNISKEVKRLKTTEGGLQTMCELLKDYVDEGRAEGLAEGMAKGMAKGENMFSSLVQKLMGLGRVEDVSKAASNSAYRRKLYREFGISSK